MSDIKNSSKTLKGRTLAWLAATLVLDTLILLVFAYHSAAEDLTLTRMAVIRGSLITFLPIPTLIFTLLVSANIKAILVFWRIKYPLPGSQAFSVHAPSDHRIDLDNLKKHVGDFPVNERDQNSKWYGLYKLVEFDSSVADSHKNYLLFRDVAAMSIFLAPVAPTVMYFFDIDQSLILISAGWFVGQYFIAALAARNAGIRFVQNVLAIHASRNFASTSTAKEVTG